MIKELAEAGMLKNTVQKTVRNAFLLSPINSSETFKVQVSAVAASYSAE